MGDYRLISPTLVVQGNLDPAEKPVKALIVGSDPYLTSLVLEHLSKPFDGVYQVARSWAEFESQVKFNSPFLPSKLTVYKPDTSELKNVLNTVGSYVIVSDTAIENLDSNFKVFDCRVLDKIEALKVFSLMLKSEGIKLSDVQKKACLKSFDYCLSSASTFLDKLVIWGATGFVSESDFNDLLFSGDSVDINYLWRMFCGNRYSDLAQGLSKGGSLMFLGFLSYKITKLLQLKDASLKEESKDLLAKQLGISYYQLTTQLEDIQNLGTKFLNVLPGKLLFWERMLKSGGSVYTVAQEMHFLRESCNV